MAYQQIRHVRFPSDNSDDTVVGSPPLIQQPTVIREGEAQDIGAQAQYQCVDLNYSSPYSYPSNENNDGNINYVHEANPANFGEQWRDEVAYLNTKTMQESSPHAISQWSLPTSETLSSKKQRRKSLASSSTSHRLSKSSSWTPELVSLILAVLAVAAMVALLSYFDGRALPLWPNGFVTLNAVVAVLATVATAGVGVPLSSGLGQLKWIRFRTRGGAPLADMELFDDASRGAMGAVGLLARMRGGALGSFGAAIVIITLLISPFSQQIATYPNRTVAVSAPDAATNYRALNYSLVLPGADELAAFVPILPLKAAVYNGLFAENGKPWLSLPFTCQTGNCTWQPFDTLAVCYSCVDMSEYMSRSCVNGTPSDGDMSNCGWMLPSGAKLKTAADVFSMTPLFPTGMGDSTYSTIMKLVFMGTESQSGQPGVLHPWARQCTLQACVQTISSTVTNGQLNETVLAITTNDTITSQSSALSPIAITPRNSTATTNLTSSPSSSQATTYLFSREAVMGIQLWWSTLFKTGSASRNAEFINRTISSITPANSTVANTNAVVVNLTVGISSGTTFFDTDIVQAFYWNYYEYPTGIDDLVRDLAVSTTVSMRSLVGAGAEAVNGTAFRGESFVRVRWGFAAVPVFAVLATGTFLALVAWRSGRVGARLWKSSALAVMVHGLDGEARRGVFGGVEGLREQKKVARRVVVRLEEGDGRGGMLRVEGT